MTFKTALFFLMLFSDIIIEILISPVGQVNLFINVNQKSVKSSLILSLGIK